MTFGTWARSKVLTNDENFGSQSAIVCSCLLDVTQDKPMNPLRFAAAESDEVAD